MAFAWTFIVVTVTAVVVVNVWYAWRDGGAREVLRLFLLLGGTVAFGLAVREFLEWVAGA